MKITRELRVGLISILALVLLYWGFNFLKGKDIFSNKKIIYAIYEKVDGLSPSRPVTINGFKVGQVDNIYFHPDGSGRLIAALNITTDFQISKSSIAEIQSNSLMGDKVVELILGDTPIAAISGDTLASDIQLSLTEEVNRQVAPIKQKAETLISDIDTVMVLISGFLNEQTKDNFEATFNSLKRSFLVLENTIKTVDETVGESQGDLKLTFKNIAEITTTLKESGVNIEATIVNLNSITDSLAEVRFKETFRSLNKALTYTESVMEKIDNGDGSVGLLVNDPEMYKNLEEATKQLNLLLLDVKYNPNRYVNFSLFGNKKQYSEEEIREMEEEAEKKRKKEKDN